MPKALFQVSPEIIRAYSHYLDADHGAEQIDFIWWINDGYEYDYNIPRLAAETTEFKNKVLDESFSTEDQKIIAARKFLPEIYSENIFSSYIHRDIEVVGNIDISGFGTAYMFTSVDKYDLPAMSFDPSLWLLRGMEASGFEKMKFFIKTKMDLAIEEYELKDYNFARLEETLEHLAEFLRSNRHIISNKTIYLK